GVGQELEPPARVAPGGEDRVEERPHRDAGALETGPNGVDDEGAIRHHRLDDAHRRVPSVARILGRDGAHAELRSGRGEEAEGRGDERRRLLGGQLLRVAAAAREEEAREGARVEDGHQADDLAALVLGAVEVGAEIGEDAAEDALEAIVRGCGEQRLHPWQVVPPPAADAYGRAGKEARHRPAALSTLRAAIPNDGGFANPAGRAKAAPCGVGSSWPQRCCSRGEGGQPRRRTRGRRTGSSARARAPCPPGRPTAAGSCSTRAARTTSRRASPRATSGASPPTAPARR